MNWPRRLPVFALTGAALACVAGLMFLRLWAHHHPIQRFYFPDYFTTSIYAGSTPKPFDVILPGGSIGQVILSPRGFNRWLETTVYGSIYQTFRWPMIGFGASLLIGLCVGGYYDSRHNMAARAGRLVRGPKLVSASEFNRKTAGDGLRFQSGPDSHISIPRNREAHHIQVAGDTGAGKSTVIRDILYQVEARGEVAIIFDPDREYMREFFDEARGDWVLNPKDERCPYWPIGDEASDEAEATPIANGLFPDGPTVQKFFLNHTRSIFAYLLATYCPSVAELSTWMAHPEEIDKRVKGTEHEHTLTANAAPQRAGILGSLNEAGKPLRMMPFKVEGRRIWTAREWAETRQGWIFITSTPDSLDALRPLQSLWLDLLILKLQSGAQSQKRVWMILDEVAALNQLPQLHSALTRQRKSDNPIVLGFQGMSQIEFLYGDKMAQTILSQAFTNIVLRTGESNAAHHLSDMIGKQELERIRETRPASAFGSKGRSYSTDRTVVPVVMESEIQTLDDLTGYFVQLDKVVKISFTPRQRRVRAEGLIERMIPASVETEETDTPWRSGEDVLVGE